MQSQVVTSCKDCCFAQYQGITQTGCELRRFDAFKKHNIEPIEAYDEEKEFFIILDHQCMFKRSAQWRERQTNVSLMKIWDDTPFPVHVIIMGGKETQDILDTIDDAARQTVSPAKITVIRPYGTTSDMKKIRHRLQEYQGSHNIKWRLENILRDDLSAPTRMHQLTLKNNKIPFLLFVNAGITLAEDALKDIKRKIYLEMMQFNALINDRHDPSIIFMPYSIWEYFRLTTSPDKPLISNITTTNLNEGNDRWKNILKISTMEALPRWLLSTPAKT